MTDTKTPADRLAEALTRLIDAADDAVGYQYVEATTNTSVAKPVAQYDDGEWPAALKNAIKAATDVLSAYDARKKPTVEEVALEIHKTRCVIRGCETVREEDLDSARAAMRVMGEEP